MMAPTATVKSVFLPIISMGQPRWRTAVRRCGSYRANPLSGGMLQNGKEANMTDRVGQQLHSYQLIRLEGSGSFAKVYVGRHVNTGWNAAIKVLEEEQEREGFRQEADILF